MQDYWIITIDLIDGGRITVGPYADHSLANEIANSISKEADGWVGISVTKLVWEGEARRMLGIEMAGYVPGEWTHPSQAGDWAE